MTSCPLFASLIANCAPIIPVPITPIFIGENKISWDKCNTAD